MSWKKAGEREAEAMKGGVSGGEGPTVLFGRASAAITVAAQSHETAYQLERITAPGLI